MQKFGQKLSFQARSTLSMINSYPSWPKVDLLREHNYNEDLTYQNIAINSNMLDEMNTRDTLGNINVGFGYLSQKNLLNVPIMGELGLDLLNSNYWDKLGDDPDYTFRKHDYSRLKFISKNNNGDNYDQHDDVSGGKIIRLEHKAFVIPNDENAKIGDTKREFTECSNEFLSDPFISVLLYKLCYLLPFDNDENKLSASTDINIGIHPMRIIDDGTGIGLPTPEGIHRDGCQFTAIILINKHNCDPQCGLTKVYNKDAQNGLMEDMSKAEIKFNETECLLFTKILHQPFELLLLNDRIVKHSVTGIKPTNGNNKKHAQRDVLVITFMTPEFEEKTYSKYK